MKNFFTALSILFTIIFFQTNLHAQLSHGGMPPTIQENIDNALFPLIKFQPPDVASLLKEDEFTDKHGIAMRFAVSLEANINIAKDGDWMRLKDGTSICRLALQSEGAQALIMYYGKFVIPEGGRLYIYNQNKTQIIGAFTHLTNPMRSNFATEMILGETTIFEYHAPSIYANLPEIIVEEVGFVYRSAEPAKNPKGFGDSQFCEVNVKCPEGNDWYNQIRGITRIIAKQGGSSVWCSGSLINNVRMDKTPYVLTADHCGPNATPENYNQWVFYFRYQGFECENPTTDTTFNNYSIIGCSKKAAAGGSGVESDFKLILLNMSVPEYFEPYYNGWSAIDEPSDFGVTIHHPQGDIKKISTYTEPLISTNWGSVPNTHWRVVWSATETNWGVTEGGSSGSPIFNSDQLIVGQLTGGDASCTNQSAPDYYGKFSHSWNEIGTGNETKLQPWLDPDNSGVLELGGLTTAILTNSNENHFSVFPNPVSNIAIINFGENFQNSANIKVTDLSGRVIIDNEKPAGDNQFYELNLSDFAGGIYFVQIESDGSTQTLKIIRQP
jgi:hypothetical protein